MFIPCSKMRRHDTDLNLHLGWKGEKGLMCLACIQSKGEGSTGELRLLLAHWSRAALPEKPRKFKHLKEICISSTLM